MIEVILTHSHHSYIYRYIQYSRIEWKVNFSSTWNQSLSQLVKLSFANQMLNGYHCGHVIHTKRAMLDCNLKY